MHFNRDRSIVQKEVLIDFLQMKGVCDSNAHIMPDHQFRQLRAVNEHHLELVPLAKSIAGFVK
jgi:hypothetical protein